MAAVARVVEDRIASRLHTYVRIMASHTCKGVLVRLKVFCVGRGTLDGFGKTLAQLHALHMRGHDVFVFGSVVNGHVNIHHLRQTHARLEIKEGFSVFENCIALYVASLTDVELQVDG